MNARFSLKYSVLGSIGVLMLSGALLHIELLPETAACGNNPNCPDGWSVDRSYCDSSPCNCSGNLISQTCFTEEGTCNATGAPVVYAHCYQGSCCCPSGNCAGQGGSGGGAEAAEEEKAEATSVGLVGIVLPDNTVMPAPDNVTTMALALAA